MLYLLEFPDSHYNNLRKTIIELMDAEEYPQSFSSGGASNLLTKPTGIQNSQSFTNIKTPGQINPSPSSNQIDQQAYRQPSGILFPLIMPPELESLVSDLDANFNTN